MVIFETKLTFTPRAEDQLNLLYRPVLEHVFERPSIGVQVCKNITPRVEQIIHSPRAIPSLRPTPVIPVLHLTERYA